MFDFRYCTRGEEVEKNQCKICEPGTYNFDPPNCLDCIENANCEGRDLLNVNQGYWRSSINSTNILECLSTKSCIGGTGIDNKTGQVATDWDIMCEKGYSGNLCHRCTVADGVLYTRSSFSDCATCPSFWKNVLRIVALLIVLVLFMSALVFVNLRKKTES